MFYDVFNFGEISEFRVDVIYIGWFDFARKKMKKMKKKKKSRTECRFVETRRQFIFCHRIRIDSVDFERIGILFLRSLNVYII